MSSTRPLSLPAFSALLKNPSALPCSSSEDRSRRTPCNFLQIPCIRTSTVLGEHYMLTVPVSSSSLAPWYHPRGQVHRAVQRALGPGVPTILSLAYSPSCAGALISVADSVQRKPYLAIIEDKAEASSNRLERSKGICRVAHPTEE